MATTDLISFRELATWTQNDEATVAADPFAVEVVEKVTGLAKFLGGHPEWTKGGSPITEAPFDVLLVVLQVAKRSYGNPDQVVSENIGPLGQRVLDVAALLLDLTETERRTLTKYNPDGDPDEVDGGNGGLWVQPTTRGTTPDLVEPVLYVPDDSLSDWYIPMFSPGDPGDPNFYPED